MPSKQLDKRDERLAAFCESSDDRMDVERYLDEHPDLETVLLPLLENVRESFGRTADIGLSVYQDPEIADEYLQINVRLPQYPADMLERLRSATEPFEGDLALCLGSLVVTSDFAPVS